MIGIATWFWPHGTEPADILAKKPTSEGWGTPANWVSAANCAMWHFSQLHFVVSPKMRLAGTDGASAKLAEALPLVRGPFRHC